MVSDPIADFLTQIKNGYMARRATLDVPHSKSKEALASILKKNGYLDTVEIVDGAKKRLRLQLLYRDRLPVLTDVKRVSKPGRRVYINNRSIPVVVGGVGIAIVSTPKGFMTDREARREKIGGELICTIW